MGHTVYFLKVFLISFVFLLGGCESNVQAPVEELRPQYSMNHPSSLYTVRPGDTLYAIAFLFDQNVEQLARLNHLSFPYQLHTGQTLRLDGKPSSIAPKMTSFISRPVVQGAWIWPTKDMNHVLEGKGINIYGQYGQPIYASQSGVVAYAGNGLPGYGLLILIKHSNNYLTAYAFNAKLMVQEGQTVRQGQQIASMGNLAPGRAGLHFEIRYKGIAINPKRFLK